MTVSYRMLGIERKSSGLCQAMSLCTEYLLEEAGNGAGEDARQSKAHQRFMGPRAFVYSR